jgi:hypothetical protein
MTTRIIVFSLILISCIAGVLAIFWHQELKYQLPTPVPAGYVSIKAKQRVSLPGDFTSGISYFLHFYNPDCPCSRFNARHIKSLIRNYSDSVRIVVVLATEGDIVRAKKEFSEDLQYFVDSDNAVAKACGVYSTPQAAIIDQEGHLFYRGNYNSSRYCTTRATNFAELSLIALLNHQPPPSFGLLSTQSYGCEWGKSKTDIDFF